MEHLIVWSVLALLVGGPISAALAVKKALRRNRLHLFDALTLIVPTLIFCGGLWVTSFYRELGLGAIVWPVIALVASYYALAIKIFVIDRGTRWSTATTSRALFLALCAVTVLTPAFAPPLLK